MISSQVVQLSLATALPAYNPGETVTALLHASTSLPEDIELQEVEVFFAGIERVDTSWVSPSYRKDVRAINTDRRRVQRYVVLSKLQAATQGTFSDGNLRKFLIRFTLPSWLPPTFKGTAVRYSYYLEAKLAYFQYDQGVVAEAAAAGVDPPKQGKSETISTRLAIQIWPEADQWNATNDMSHSNSPRASLDASTGSFNLNNRINFTADVFPALSPEDYPVKCWEIGPGTAVEDAISHITKLASGPAGPGSIPFSPGRVWSKQHQQASLGKFGGGAGGAASETNSEISHDDASEKQSVRHSRSNTISESGERPLLGSITNAPTEAGGAGGLRSFALRIGENPLARVCVHPPLMGPLQPGAVVSGTIEFPLGELPQQSLGGGDASSGSLLSLGGGTKRNPPLRCMQVSVMLETEEAVDSTWRPAGKSIGGSGGHAATLRRVLEEQIEVTADSACTHFVFSLPRDATPTFKTSLVALRWVLRFHFVAIKEEGSGNNKTEHLSWTLPLMVLPPPRGMN